MSAPDDAPVPAAPPPAAPPPAAPDADEQALRRQHEEWAAEDRVVDANPTALGE